MFKKELIVGLMILVARAGITPATANPCKDDPEIEDECYAVHGRLSHWNAVPSARIWVIGTHHLLGIHKDSLPSDVKNLVPGFDAKLTGNVLVCPSTKAEAGKMQMVCIESYSHD